MSERIKLSEAHKKTAAQLFHAEGQLSRRLLDLEREKLAVLLEDQENRKHMDKLFQDIRKKHDLRDKDFTVFPDEGEIEVVGQE